MPDDKEEPQHGEVDVVPGEQKMFQIQVKIKPPDSYTYSNVVGVSLTPWDIRLNFGDYAPRGEPVVINATVGVIMAPEHAAALSLLLRDQVMLFESQFGPIRNKQWREMMDEDVPKWEALRKKLEGIPPEELPEGLKPKS